MVGEKTTAIGDERLLLEAKDYGMEKEGYTALNG